MVEPYLRNRIMKKTAILFFLAIGLLASAQSAFYKTYAQREQVTQAAYMKNYKIEGIRVDITLLRAADSAAFRQLLSELDMAYSPSAHTLGMLFCLRQNDAPGRKIRPKEGRIALRGACLVGASEAELTIYVFHNLRNETRLHKILNFILRKQRQGTAAKDD